MSANMGYVERPCDKQGKQNNGKGNPREEPRMVLGKQSRAGQERTLSSTVTEPGPEPQSNPKGDPGMWLVP